MRPHFVGLSDKPRPDTVPTSLSSARAAASIAKPATTIDRSVQRFLWVYRKTVAKGIA